MVVASGGRWADPDTGELEDKHHLRWRLNEPATGSDLAKLKAARRLAAELVGADTSNVSVVHPIRWAGGWHRKAEPRLARIVSDTENEIDLTDALDRLQAARPAGAEKPKGKTGRKKGKGPFGFDTSDKKLDAEHALDVAAALAAIGNADLPWDEWNKIGMAICTATEGKGFAIFDSWSQKSAKYNSETTRGRCEHYETSPPNDIGAGTLFHLARETRPGWRKPSDYNKEEGEHPVIRIVAGELPRMVDEAEGALIAAETPIFVRAGALVRPVTEEAPAAHGRSTMVAKLRDYRRDNLTDALSKVAEFQRYNIRKKAWLKAELPHQVGNILLAREGSWNLPAWPG
jgi:hypothetical protein